MNDQELMDLAKRTMGAAVGEPIGSIERGMKWAAYDAIVTELQRRLANRVNEELGYGFPPIELQPAPTSGLTAAACAP